MFRIKVIEDATDEVVKTIDTTTKKDAEVVQSGLEHTINHNQFSIEVEEING